MVCPSRYFGAAAIRRTVLIAATGLAVAAALGARPAWAQQRPPAIDFGPYLDRHATRWYVPVLGGAGGSTVSLSVANTGYGPTDLAVVALPTGGRAGCATTAPTALAVRCVRALAVRQTVHIDLPVAGDAQLLVYSLAPASVDGCGRLADLAAGSATVAAWEQAVWLAGPGQPVAVTGRASAGDNVIGLAPVATTGLSTAFKAAPGGAGRRGALSQALPYAPASGAQVAIANVDGACARVDARIGGTVAPPACTPPRTATFELAPLAVGPVAAGGAPAGVRAVWASAAEETVGSVAWQDGDGWAAYPSLGPRETENHAGRLAFPVAMAGLANERSELWVSNLHPTATAQIDINMWDANGNLLRFHGDSDGICAGGTKRYDLAAIAGEVPPLGGADVPPERQGPRYLSLRVESKNLSLATAPPIAGVVILRGDEGVEAVAGMSLPLLLSRPSGRQVGGATQRPRGEARTVTVVPGVMHQFGPDRRTTTIAVTLIGETRVENAAAADIYDEDGALVIAGVGVRAGATTGYLDLGRPLRAPGGGSDAPAQGFRLPAGFRGTVVLRSPQGRAATFGAVAIHRPTLMGGRPAPAPASGESVSVEVGSIVPVFSDPNAPTATPFPTRPPATPTGAASTPPTASATPRGEATPTAAPAATVRLWLPRLLRTGP